MVWTPCTHNTDLSGERNPGLMVIFRLRENKLWGMNGGMAKRLRKPTPIFEDQTTRVRVGWQHPACGWCGRSFITVRRDAKTCSEACRSRVAFEKRKRQRDCTA
ncbi:unnamed protein product [marine sediment metagenome]|uniref:Uncharacterized protein n=1 Tax=marine sediment metagenome TaxID=412755 RepID=X0TV46_9ZZZZ